MAKKSRRERKAEGMAAPVAPRVPSSATLTPTVPAPHSVAPSASPRPAAPPPTPRASRAAAVNPDTGARIPQREMLEEWHYVRQDLRRIFVLAGVLFIGLIVLSLTLPGMLGF